MKDFSKQALIPTSDRPSEEHLLRVAILKERAAYRAFWKEHGGEKVLKEHERGYGLYGTGDDVEDSFAKYETEGNVGRFQDGLFSKFGVIMARGRLFKEAFESMDPFNNKTSTQTFVSFEDPFAVIEVFFDGQPLPLGENGLIRLELPLKPSERLLKVDLSCKKGQLLAEFKSFLESIDMHRQLCMVEPDLFHEFKENYEQWNQNGARFVKEAWRHLEVWRLRRQRQPFLEICRITGIKVDAAKKSFARAYELIEGRRYDPKRYKELYKEIVALELKKTCSTCQERDSCTEPCPDVMAFIDQEDGKQTALLTSTGTVELLRKDIYEANQEVQDEIDRRLTPAGK